MEEAIRLSKLESQKPQPHQSEDDALLAAIEASKKDASLQE